MLLHVHVHVRSMYMYVYTATCMYTSCYPAAALLRSGLRLCPLMPPPSGKETALGLHQPAAEAGRHSIRAGDAPLTTRTRFRHVHVRAPAALGEGHDPGRLRPTEHRRLHHAAQHRESVWLRERSQHKRSSYDLVDSTTSRFRKAARASCSWCTCCARVLISCGRSSIRPRHSAPRSSSC